MSKVWEFAITPARSAIVAACLTVAGLILGGGGFAAGVILAPRLRPVDNKAPRMQVASFRPPKVAEKAAVQETGTIKNANPADEKPANGSDKAAAPPALPAADPATAAEKKPEHPPLPIQLDVQVGSFDDEKNALITVDRLKRSGYPAFAFPWTDARSHHWHVVQVGPYSAYEAAARTVLELSTRYRLSPVIISSKTF